MLNRLKVSWGMGKRFKMPVLPTWKEAFNRLKVPAIVVLVLLVLVVGGLRLLPLSPSSHAVFTRQTLAARESWNRDPIVTNRLKVDIDRWRPTDVSPEAFQAEYEAITGRMDAFKCSYNNAYSTIDRYVIDGQCDAPEGEWHDPRKGQ